MKEGRTQKIFLLFGFFVFLLFGARAADAATLYFSPSSGNFTVGNVFTVNVLVNTENADINNAETTVNFPSGLLEIISISKSGSIFSLWVDEPTFSNSVGTLSFNGGLPTPGFKGTVGKIISATFRVKRAGSASLVFSSAAVRANDGYGTNVFSSGAQASFNLIGEEKITPVPAPVVGVPAAPRISSSTHPDPEKWYSNNAPEFSWTVPSDVNAARLLYDKFSNSRPTVGYNTAINRKSLSDIADGAWYFHVQLHNNNGWGEISHFKFQIDTGLPENLEVVRADPQDTTNPNPKFNLRAADSLSGVDHYEAKIDHGESTRLSIDDSGYYPLPSQTPGKKQLTVRAYDQAGNYIESSPQELQVEAIVIISPIKPAWYVGFEPVLELLTKVFDAIINLITAHLILFVALLAIGGILGQLVSKGIPYFAEEIKKLQFIASEYRASKKLKKLDSKTKLELKILEKDIKKELELLNKIASHRSLHSDEQYLRNKLEKYYSILRKL